MNFVETSHFTKSLYTYLSEEEYLGMQVFLLQNPEYGSVIPGSGGVRKLRWNSKGKGKRGGIRVIYYLKIANDQIFLLTIYSKNETQDIATHILKRIKEGLEND